MPTVFISPFSGQQFFLNVAQVNNGGQIQTYAAGTTTPSATYTTSTGNVTNPNPIILDSTGRVPGSGEIWQVIATPLKYVFMDSLSNVLATYDNIPGIGDTSSSAGSTAEWVASGFTPTFISGTQFSVTGNQTATFQVGRRTKSTVTAGTIYSSITVSSFGGGITTVTLVNDSGNLDAGLSAVQVGILAALNPSVPAILPYSLAINGITGAAITTSTFSGTTVSGTAITGSTSVTTPIIEAAAATSLDLAANAAGIGGGWRVNTTAQLLTNPANTQYGFLAVRTAGAQTSGTTILFDSTAVTGGFNYGAGYATGTGIFTIPAGGTGIYALGAVAILNNNTGAGLAFQINLVVNGSTIFSSTPGANFTSSANVLAVFAIPAMHFNAGDTVLIANQVAFTANTGLQNGSHFSMRLVG